MNKNFNQVLLATFASILAPATHAVMEEPVYPPSQDSCVVALMISLGNFVKSKNKVRSFYS